jgi:hypothetical protein
MSPERRAALIAANRELKAKLLEKLALFKQRQRAREATSPPAAVAELATDPHSRADLRPVRRRLSS